MGSNPVKKRGTSVSDKMAARARSSVMDSTGTGDPSMDRILSGEVNRRAAFANAARATKPKSENGIMSALKKMFGRK